MLDGLKMALFLRSKSPSELEDLLKDALKQLSGEQLQAAAGVLAQELRSRAPVSV